MATASMKMNFDRNRQIIRFNTREAKYIDGTAVFSFLGGLTVVGYSQPELYRLGLTDTAEKEK